MAMWNIPSSTVLLYLTTAMLSSRCSDGFVSFHGTTQRAIDIVVYPSSSAWTPKTSSSLNMSSRFIGMDDDDDDEDEDDDDDDDLGGVSRYSGAKSPFTGMKLDPYDPNPIMKPRPSRFFKDKSEPTIPDDQLVQTMTDEQRKENLTVMRQIKKNDLPDLQRRKDHAGWVEANNDLKRRIAKDPWFRALIQN